jgi:DNA-binding winged helix-turn-helix (wHTH) protein
MMVDRRFADDLAMIDGGRRRHRMNRVSGINGDTLLRTADLAARPEFRLGEALIIPGTRTVRGPGGEADLEPRVMQVLVVLADAAGQVVTRETLFQRCWGNVYVGDDSLNRAVAGVRRIAETVAAGSFTIETVPRTGYQLIVKSGAQPRQAPGGGETASTLNLVLKRRSMVAGGIAAAAIAGGGIWWINRPRPDPRFEALMARGDEAFRDGSAFEQWDADATRRPNLIRLYEEAVRLHPGSARAWGLLAYFMSARADGATPQDSARLVADAKATIRRALQIDPREPNARVAAFLFEGRMLDWAARDRRLREILATDADNLPAMIELMPLLQAAGFTRESWGWNERILHASPLARPFLVVKSLKLWILGRVRESDNVIDRVRGLWPEYGFGNWARFMLFALTGRPQAALAMLDSAPDGIGGPDVQAMWRAVLEALETRAPAAIATARAACLEQATRLPVMVNDIVMILGALGQTDAAFEVTEGFLLWRGKLVSADQADGKAMDDYSRRMTQWLFTPPVAAMRADPRFLKLCDEFGLTAYWRERGVKPDYQLSPV